MQEVAITLLAGTGITKNRLGTLNAGTGVVDLCTATLVPLGMLMDDVDAGEAQGIALDGVQELTAAGAFARGAVVYPAASGKVDDALVTGGRPYGVALAAAAADGDIVRVLRVPLGPVNP